MESAADFWTAKALLDWQVEMGADEAICDAPIDRYALEDKPTQPKQAAPAEPAEAAAEAPPVDAVAEARDAAKAAQDLDGLRAAMGAFDHCELKAAARNLIFADGVPGSDVLFLTDPPDREDDRAGRLFSGQTGVLFDKMIGAIGLTRTGDASVYMVPVLPWNPPQNRDPSAEELAMMRPFLERHIELARPKHIVLMGNGPCQALLGRSGMTRLRGTWTSVADLPALPMFGPAHLLATPAAKRDTWADLLDLKSKLKAPA